MVLQRWEPFRELRNMEDTMNRLWRGFGGYPAFREGGEDWNILVDVIRKPEEIIVKASVPGINPEDIDVSVEDNVLAIKAERNEEVESGDSTYLVKERTSGSYYRALRLPDTVDTSKIDCTYDSGVLSIRLPRAEEKKKKRIQINVGSGPKAIGTSSRK